MTRVRRITADDWQLARTLRLEALADAPDAFAATLEEEQAFPEARWRARADSNARGVETAGFFGCDAAGNPRATAVGVYLSAEPVPTVELAALWVAPELRGSDLAQALVEAVLTWARERGAEQVILEVTETSSAAQRLYERMGFQVVEGLAVTCGTRRAPALRMRKPL